MLTVCLPLFFEILEKSFKILADFASDFGLTMRNCFDVSNWNHREMGIF